MASSSSGLVNLADDSKTKSEFIREVQKMAGSGIAARYAHICHRLDDGLLAIYQVHSETELVVPLFKSWEIREPHAHVHPAYTPKVVELMSPTQLQDADLLMKLATSFRYFLMLNARTWTRIVDGDVILVTGKQPSFIMTNRTLSRFQELVAVKSESAVVILIQQEDATEEYIVYSQKFLEDAFTVVSVFLKMYPVTTFMVTNEGISVREPIIVPTETQESMVVSTGKGHQVRLRKTKKPRAVVIRSTPISEFGAKKNTNLDHILEPNFLIRESREWVFGTLCRISHLRAGETVYALQNRVHAVHLLKNLLSEKELRREWHQTIRRMYLENKERDRDWLVKRLEPGTCPFTGYILQSRSFEVQDMQTAAAWLAGVLQFDKSSKMTSRITSVVRLLQQSPGTLFNSQYPGRAAARVLNASFPHEALVEGETFSDRILKDFVTYQE